MNRRTALKGMAAAVAGVTAVPAAHVAGALETNPAKAEVQLRERWFKFDDEDIRNHCFTSKQAILIQERDRFVDDGCYLWDNNGRQQLMFMFARGPDKVLVCDNKILAAEVMSYRDLNPLIIGKVKGAYTPL